MKRILVLALLLAGCGPPAYMVRARDLSVSGQCAAAEAQVYQNASDPGTRAGLLGAIANDCYHDQAATIRYLNLAARYGNPVAQEHLSKIGQPVPAADLKGRDTNCFYAAGMLSCSSN